MIYSKTCEYALRALSYLAGRKSEARITIPEITRKTGVPGPYLAKVFQSLAKSGILKSHRGPEGGFALKKRPEAVSIMDVLKVIDDISLLNQCVMGFDECSEGGACPLHHIWKKAESRLLLRLQRTSLRGLAHELGKYRYRYRKLARGRLNRSLSLLPPRKRRVS